MSSVLLVTVDDWEALYIDDVCVEQGHSVRLEDALRAVQHLGPFTVELYQFTDELENYSYETGELPSTATAVRALHEEEKEQN